jgi:cytochrome c553
MTHAERNRLYRNRQREAVMTAYGKPAGQPTAAILQALGRQLAQLDDTSQSAMHDTLRHMAEQAMRELCTRYGLHPESPPVTKAGESSRRRK